MYEFHLAYLFKVKLSREWVYWVSKRFIKNGFRLYIQIILVNI